jgi:hypothetical protein
MNPERNESTATERYPRQLTLEPALTLPSRSVLQAQLEIENARLQKLVAELLIRNQQLRDQLEAARDRV